MTKFKIFGLVLMLALAVSSASADTVNFNGQPALGDTWSLSGGFNVGSTLTASTSGILLTTAVGNVPGVIFGFGDFTFTTGGLTSSGGGDASFGAGGTISACYGLVCMTGIFTGGSFLDNGGGTYSFSAPFVFASVDPAILAALGVSGTTDFTGSLSATLNNDGAGERGTMGTIGATINQVPEPASMFLLGTGLVGAGRLVRKKLAA